MKKKLSVSVIVTYKNEQKNIEKTFDKIISQSLQPAEVIFINSNSTDKSSSLLQNKIKNCKKKIKFKNFKLDTNLPSTSKNLGIQVSENNILAFMDCDLIFDSLWLEKKIKFMIKEKVAVVLSTCKLQGYNSFDKACVANTYGLNAIVPCIPGSVFKKKIFDTLGFFIPSRSYYDVDWKKKLFLSKEKFKIDYQNNITYTSKNYASDIKDLFFKSYRYISDKVNLIKNYQIYFYFLSFLFFIFVLFANPKYLILFFITYLFLRISLAIKKCHDSNYFKSPLNYFYLILSFIVIDVGRFCGSVASIINFFKYNIFVLSLVLFIFLFNSPLPYLFERNLSGMSQINKNSFDTIVIFSGDGNIKYSNEEYKDRALQALEIIKTTKVSKIILSSGRENKISDVEIIRNFLEKRGIDKDKIYVFSEYPKSTYENIILVGEYLKKNNYKNILFITKNIHNKRSLLIWKKKYPDIAISLPNSNLRLKWSYNLNELISITYEYLAIIHNFFLNRL